jgi:hypothetical protein
LSYLIGRYYANDISVSREPIVIVARVGLLGSTSPSGAQSAQVQISCAAFVSAVAALAASPDDLVANERNATRQVCIRQKVYSRRQRAARTEQSPGLVEILLDEPAKSLEPLSDRNRQEGTSILRRPDADNSSLERSDNLETG